MSEITWPDLISRYVTHLASSGRARSTRDVRRRHLNRLAEHIGKPLVEVTGSDLEQWLDNSAWNNNTRRSAHASLIGFFRWLDRIGAIDHNPTAWLGTVPAIPGTPRPCPENALQAAYATADGRGRLILGLGAGAGLRRAEIASSRREDVEDAIGGPIMRVTGKGGRTRTVPLSDWLADMVRSQPPGWLFPSPAGGHLTPTHVGRLAGRMLPDGWTTHTLRHRFASAAYAVDNDLRAVQELLGHTSVATTQVYTALPDGAKRRAAVGAAIAA